MKREFSGVYMTSKVLNKCLRRIFLNDLKLLNFKCRYIEYCFINLDLFLCCDMNITFLQHCRYYQIDLFDLLKCLLT